MEVIDFGIKDYLQVLKLQKDLFSKKLSGDKNSYILIGEHPNVYTLGKRTKKEHLYDIPSNVPIINIDRGGSITFHGKGQLVVYPIINLKDYNLSVKRYVYLLEESMLRTCKTFGIDAFRKEGYPGVFTDKGKIGFTGTKVSRYITMHGFSLNVDVNKTFFKRINPCGIGTEVCNITDFDPSVRLKDVKAELLSNLLQLF